MRIDKDCWLLNKPIAHRGLWGNGVPENSTRAYEQAAEKKIPIEIDVHLTADGKLVSFHDDDLFRVTGEKGLIWSKTLKELKKLKLSESEYSVPTLNEVFEIAKGKSPLLIEFKNQPAKAFLQTAIDALKNYNGEFAVQSFNPFYIYETRKRAPEFIRGILADGFCQEESAVKRWVVKKMPFNFLAKPDFISYNYECLPLKKSKRKHAALLAWTLTDEQAYLKIKNECDNVIYELFDI